MGLRLEQLAFKTLKFCPSVPSAQATEYVEKNRVAVPNGTEERFGITSWLSEELANPTSHLETLYKIFNAENGAWVQIHGGVPESQESSSILIQ